MQPKAGGDLVTEQDRRFLERAVALGRRGWGMVHPNPMVGCVVVKDGAVLGEGWHERVGEAHAEINALARAGSEARDATAYVSLEPCNHFGRTPPCSHALAEAGVRRVVFGGLEPGEAAAGGAQTLRRRGVDVVGPVFTLEQSRRENPAFYFNYEHRATYVALKLAQTLDGRISAGPGQRTNITGPEALTETHRLRAGFDGVMVGSETVRVDDPLLTVRAEVPCGRQPVRVILDTEASTVPSSRIFQDAPEIPVVVFAAQDASPEAVGGLEAAGAEVHRVPRAAEGLSLPAVMKACWDREIRSLFCEGGARVARSLIHAGIARRLYLFVAPFVLGEKGVPAFPGAQPREVWDRWEMGFSPVLFGQDVLMTLDRME